MYPTITMPTLDEVVPGANPENPTPEQADAYNAHCTELVRKALESSEYVRTHYPFDLPDGSSDDTLALDGAGEIITVDEGVQ